MTIKSLVKFTTLSIMVIGLLATVGCGGEKPAEEPAVEETTPPPPPPPPPAAKKRADVQQKSKTVQTEEEFHAVEETDVVVIDEVEFIPHRFSYSELETDEPLHINMKAFDVAPIFGKKCVDDDTPDDCSHDAIERWLKSNINFPDEAKKFDGITEYVTFVVKPDGSVDGSNILVLPQDPQCHACAAEALTLVRNMPKWIPAQKGGTPVQARVTLPIRFENSGD